MPAILLAVTGADPQPWAEALRALAPAREIRLWPDGVGEGADVAYACAWYAPRGLYARLHRLLAIFSLGAGVELILAVPDLSIRTPESVVLPVLLHHRRQRLYDIQQRERVWHELAQPVASTVAVGVM